MQVKCPRCNSENYVKNGKMNNKQRYLCKECKYNFSSFQKRGKSNEIKEQALKMYLEGLGFRAIGRLLNVSNVSVLRWIKKISNKLKEIIEKENKLSVSEIKKMELDEMWHYVKKKKKNSGSGLQLIEMLKI
jgi:transposase